MAGAGAPLKLTPEIQEKFCNYIRAGNRPATASKLCRLHPNTTINWMVQGEQDEAGPYREFYDAVVLADAECEALVVQQWQEINQDKKDWRSNSNFLQMRHKWEPPATKTEHKIETTTIERHDISRLSPGELESLAKLLDKASGDTIEAEFESVEQKQIQ